MGKYIKLSELYSSKPTFEANKYYKLTYASYPDQLDVVRVGGPIYTVEAEEDYTSITLTPTLGSYDVGASFKSFKVEWGTSEQYGNSNTNTTSLEAYTITSLQENTCYYWKTTLTDSDNKSSSITGSIKTSFSKPLIGGTNPFVVIGAYRSSDQARLTILGCEYDSSENNIVLEYKVEAKNIDAFTGVQVYINNTEVMFEHGAAGGWYWDDLSRHSQFTQVGNSASYTTSPISVSPGSSKVIPIRLKALWYQAYRPTTWNYTSIFQTYGADATNSITVLIPSKRSN